MPSNYPDDIRCYDHDPRSPFYDDRRERAEEEALEDLPAALRKQVARLGLSLEASVEEEADEDGPYHHIAYALNGQGFDENDAEVLATALGRLDSEHPELEELVEETLEEVLGG